MCEGFFFYFFVLLLFLFYQDFMKSLGGLQPGRGTSKERKLTGRGLSDIRVVVSEACRLGGCSSGRVHS